jgi:hypothetical protein
MPVEFHVDSESVAIPKNQSGKSTGRNRGGLAHALRQLNIDGSVWVPGRLPRQLHSSISQVRKTNPEMRFLAREMEEDGVTGTRIWRVAPPAEAE